MQLKKIDFYRTSELKLKKIVEKAPILEIVIGGNGCFPISYVSDTHIHTCTRTHIVCYVV